MDRTLARLVALSQGDYMYNNCVCYCLLSLCLFAGTSWTFHVRIPSLEVQAIGIVVLAL